MMHIAGLPRNAFKRNTVTAHTRTNPVLYISSNLSLNSKFGQLGQLLLDGDIENYKYLNKSRREVYG